MARYLHDEKLKPLPGVAPVAVQQGTFVAKVITSRIQKKSPPTFKYKDYGKMATIGRAAAVADLGKNLKFSGFLAWMMWLFIHMMEIVSFRNRLLVLLQWGWHYLSYDRAARLITGDDTHTPLPKTQVAHSEAAPTPQPSTVVSR
jgi:NADH dehydrogenase